MNNKINIVCFGDSNTHGYNSVNKARFDENERWTSLLAKILGDSYLVHEEGLSGRTAGFDDPLEEGLNGFRAAYPIMKTHEPIDLMIVMLGTNDTKERFKATPENIAKGMNRLIKKMTSTQGWRSKPNILIITPPPIDVRYVGQCLHGEMGDGCAEKSSALAALFKKIAEDNECHFLDVGKIPGVEMEEHDYIHMSKESHKIMAMELAKIVPELV